MPSPLKVSGESYGLMTKEPDCSLGVSEFKLEPLQTNSLWNRMRRLILRIMDGVVSLQFFDNDAFGIKKT